MITKKLNLLLDLLEKKKEVLIRILNISENQGEVLKSSAALSVFCEMAAEKQIFIEDVLKCDTVFQSVFDGVKDYLETLSEQNKVQIVGLQSLIKEVTELDIKVRIQEDKNKQILDKRKEALKSAALPTAAGVGKNALIQKYKENSGKK